MVGRNRQAWLFYVMRADGSDMRVLTDNQYEEGTPTWAPRWAPAR
jgi:hypothetical protein